MRYTLPLALLLVGCTASADKATDTDVTSETDLGGDTDATADTDPADTDVDDTDAVDTDSTDTDDTDVTPTTVLTWRTDQSGSVFTGSGTSADVTVSCGADGHGYAFRMDFDGNNFVRMGVPYLPTGTFLQEVRYLPVVGHLFRLSTGTGGTLEDWTLSWCDVQTTAPAGIAGDITFGITCYGDMVHQGQLGEGEVTVTALLEAGSCTPTASTMQSCASASPSIPACNTIPNEVCDDFAGCATGTCEADPAACLTLSDEQACNAATGCQFNGTNQTCIAAPLSDCLSFTLATSCDADSTCAWNDQVGCSGTTTCSELSEIDCLQRHACTPVY